MRIAEKQPSTRMQILISVVAEELSPMALHIRDTEVILSYQVENMDYCFSIEKTCRDFFLLIKGDYGR